MINRNRARALLIAAGGVLAALTAACGPVALEPASTSTPATAADLSAQGGTTTQQQPERRFPNTDQTVLLTGYDEQHKMVTFKLAVLVPGGADNGHYEQDPKDAATHRLPLSDSPQITSFAHKCSGPVAGDNENVDGRVCGKDEFTYSLTDPDTRDDYAKLHVDSNDRIDTVHALYHP